eukprot:6343923-Karenia_brevis.AAC.1
MVQRCPSSRFTVGATTSIPSHMLSSSRRLTATTQWHSSNICADTGSLQSKYKMNCDESRMIAHGRHQTAA